MKYIIKRVDNDNEEIILTYDIPGFPEGSLVVPAPMSAITKVQFSLPRWDFRDVNGNYVPEGEYEISLVVPDKVGQSLILCKPQIRLQNDNIIYVVFVV